MRAVHVVNSQFFGAVRTTRDIISTRMLYPEQTQTHEHGWVNLLL